MSPQLFFPRIGRTYRHIRRLRQILDILLAQGFGFLISRTNLQPLIPWPSRLRRHFPSPGEATVPGQIRRVLELLGPTYIKLGQMLASRPDVLPPAYVNEFGRLRDQVQPLPFAQIRPVVAAELQRPLEDIFSEFNEGPIASASLAQVYAATLNTGERVVVKVQRPGVRDLIRTDLEILAQWVGVLAERFPELAALNPREILDEFSLAIQRELDFATEAANAERLRKNLAVMPRVRVPKVFWEYTTANVLVMELLEGMAANDVAGVKAAGLDAADVARRIVRCFMKQIFEDGFYHADPHPANILISPDGVINLVDCGAVGYLTGETLNGLATLFTALGTGDYERAAAGLLHIGAVEEFVDPQRFKDDLAAVVGRYYSMPLRLMDAGGMLEEVLVISRNHRLRLPPSLVMLVKTVILVEDLARALDPDFRLEEVAEPFIKTMVRRQRSPVNIGKNLAGAFGDIGFYFRDVPRDLNVLTKKLARGELKVEIEHRELTKALGEIDRSANRLSFAFVIAAIIIGSSLLFATGAGPKIFNYSVIGVVGFLVAAFLGLWLAVAMLRSGRL